MAPATVHTKSKALTILILGLLTALSPFSIDMYLAAFPEIAINLQTTVARVALSLSSYFVGLAAGQLLYGPLLDRFGRKKPLYAGLVIYILASVGCLMSHSIDGLIIFRFVQALGGCAASVATMAMVRDLFTTKESAKVFSLLILILGASPLLAPTVGSFVTAAFGWASVFIVLLLIALLLIFAVAFVLPDTHAPDSSVSLRIGPVVSGFLEILKDPQFYTYTLSGALAFAGLFVYVAGSPHVFMSVFKQTPRIYGWIFAGISLGFIGASQLNIVLLKRFRNDQILRGALIIKFVAGITLLMAAVANAASLALTICLLFVSLGAVGLANPNAAALALAPFKEKAGRAAALMGFLQMGIGASATMIVGLIDSETLMPVAASLALSGVLALGVFLLGSMRLTTISRDQQSAPI